MVVLGTADLVNLARRKTVQDRDASGDECHPYLLRTDCLRRCLPREGFPPCSTVYNIFRKFQRECSWEANDRDGATPGHWDGRPLTGQIGASGHLTSTHEIEVRGKLRNRIGKIFRTLCMI
jgi:hypothetical protein